ncbi:P-loop containing nucleoside triphosphate hydrolase protein [Xylaria arbuscula]|nr:P-loop containing nucleoside triphosphate hydrolase protein [Xylaria arbuscula]
MDADDSKKEDTKNGDSRSKPEDIDENKSEKETIDKSGDNVEDSKADADKDETPNTETGRKSIARVDQIKEWKYIYARTSKSSTKVSGKYALVVRQIFDSDGQLEETVVDIRGEALRDILATILEGAEGLRLNEKPPVIEPKLLYHCAPKLRLRLESESAAQPQDSTLIFDLEAALQLIKEDFSGDESSINSLVSKRHITFDFLWAIFPPNELIYTLDQLSEPCVYRAVNHRVRKRPDGSIVFVISSRKVDSNGKSLGWARITGLEIPMFPGEKLISDLQVFPLSFHPEYAQTRKDLLERGRRRLLLHKQGFYEYTGHALQEREDPNKNKYFEKFNSYGRVVIDHVAFGQINANSGFIPKIDRVLFDDELQDDQIITLPSMVYGFSLGAKLWGGFAVSRIEPVKWDPSIWKSLVLPNTQKRLIRTLIQNHVSNGGGFDDFVRDKGKGLVGLLAGPPGVGKTLTAEAVAESVQRPLYMLSSGELGDKPHEIDKRLSDVFELTQTWKAVLLLDEADVFMAKRTSSDITQNAIVSIFLRQLEYYQGILLLTTNRIESIDDAFQSRIHFCHIYKELDSVARKSIWLEFLKKAALVPNIIVDVSDDDVDELALRNINGRQIKNIVNMTQSIALEEKCPLTVKEVSMVADTLQNFMF